MTKVDRGSTPIERWAQHVVQAITVAAVVWFGVTLSSLKTSDAITQVKLDTLQQRIGDFSAQTSDTYTRTSAMADLKRVAERLADFEQRIRKLESIRILQDEGNP